VNSITGDLSQIFSKVDRLADYLNPAHQEYLEACHSILGFGVSAVHSQNGKKAALTIDSFNNIPITAMGEGIVNILGLITDLCLARNKVFLIEEPENDIHPTALKQICQLIVEKSKDNQFFISTHSNIVTKYLGSVQDSRV